jgi:hypothetical protein
MPVHKDDPIKSITMPDGRVIANLSDDDYNATYSQGEPHQIPPDVLAAAIEAAAKGMSESDFDDA